MSKIEEQFDEAVCQRCAKLIPANAILCPYCQFPQDSSAYNSSSPIMNFYTGSDYDERLQKTGGQFGVFWGTWIARGIPAIAIIIFVVSAIIAFIREGIRFEVEAFFMFIAMTAVLGFMMVLAVGWLRITIKVTREHFANKNDIQE